MLPYKDTGQSVRHEQSRHSDMNGKGKNWTDRQKDRLAGQKVNEGDRLTNMSWIVRRT